MESLGSCKGSFKGSLKGSFHGSFNGTFEFARKSRRFKSSGLHDGFDSCKLR